jgi:hypothetical protein
MRYVDLTPSRPATSVYLVLAAAQILYTHTHTHTHTHIQKYTCTHTHTRRHGLCGTKLGGPEPEGLGHGRCHRHSRLLTSSAMSGRQITQHRQISEQKRWRRSVWRRTVCRRMPRRIRSRRHVRAACESVGEGGGEEGGLRGSELRYSLLKSTLCEL